MENLVRDPLVQFVALLVVRITVNATVSVGGLGRLLLNIVFFSLLTGILLYHGIPPYVRDDVHSTVAERISNGTLKSIWWIGGAMVLASCARMFLILERKPREGRLLQDLVVGMIYLAAGLCIVAYVFSLPVGTIIATSGVFAIVLGLALQSTLNDVFSGIALNLGKPLSVGDWVALDDSVQGRVIETNWRSTQLLNGSNDLVVVPNSLLAKSRITNLSRPDNLHGGSLKIRFVPSKPPEYVLDTMKKVLLSSNAIVKDSLPSASIIALDGDALEIELSFQVSTLAELGRAKNELFDLLHRHSEAAGLQLASAAGAVAVNIGQNSSGPAAKRVSSPLRLVNSVGLFAALTDQEREDLASKMNRLSFRKGEIIARRNTALTSLMILRSGVLEQQEGDSDTGAVELARLAPGDFFGERGVLLGALELADICALTPAVIYEIPKDRLAAILKERPTIAEELAAILAARSDAEEALHHNGSVHGQRHSSALSVRIRQLFHLV